MDRATAVASSSPRWKASMPQRPALTQQPQLRLVQVEAQQVERRGEQEEREEGELRQAPARLQVAAPRQVCRALSRRARHGATPPARRAWRRRR
jgi:hypothetical protein